MKAIVFHGGNKKEIAYPDRLEQFSKETMERTKDTPGVQNYKRMGTPNARSHEQLRWVGFLQILHLGTFGRMGEN